LNDKASTPELSADELKKIDFIVLVDHSGSMGEPSLRLQGRTRIQEVQEDCVAIARLAQQYDDDGITAIGFSSGVNVKDGVTADAVSNIFKEFQPRGSTNLSAALKAAIDKAKASTKEVVVLAYTDGVPDNESEVINTINAAGADLGRPKIGFTFIQVGTDSGASRFLSKLDSDLKVDVVATLAAADAEALSVGQLAHLARNA
jgi:uncharacterized protein with von Willebrand factor type A (vWA) domain